MEIPTPPTDSLYKFMAIGGLVLLLAGFYIFYRASDVYLRVDIHDAALVALARDVYNRVTWLCFGAFIIGGLSAGLGFDKWRIKIQEPQDELLQIQLEQARLALAGAKKEAAKVEASEAG